MNGNANNGLMLAILAAGGSRRFGETDKLAVLLHGKMLGLHVAETLAVLPFRFKAVIVGKADHQCAEQWAMLGYQVIVNERAEQGQSASVNLAAETALILGASGLCMCLADMPMVTADHIGNLVASFEKTDRTQIIASARNDKPMPPTIFPAERFGKLERLSGDTGAKTLLSDALLINVNERILMDIDTRDDLVKANSNKP